jgi:hypothetical protein
MRWPRLLIVSAAAAAGLAIAAASPASAAVSHREREKWKRVDAPLASANNRFLRAVSLIRSDAAFNSKTVTAAQVSKPCLALAPVLETFDAAVVRIGLGGSAGRDVATVVALNQQLIGMLTHMTIPSFIVDYDVPGLITPWPTSLAPRYVALQSALAHDLGLPPAQVQI